MIWLIAAMGAAGVALMFMGLTEPLVPRLDRLVGPFVPGGDPGRGIRVRRRMAEALPVDDLLERRLLRSGRTTTPGEFRGEQVAWGAVGASAAAGWCAWAAAAGADVSLPGAVLLVSLAASAGAAACDRRLTLQGARRRREVEAGLPPAMDLMTLCVTAGESVGGAIARVARVMNGAVADELSRVAADVRAGVPLVDALDAFSARLDSPLAGRFADALTVALERGAPLADALRAQADDARDRERTALLEQGGRREVLMLVPIVFLILPVVVAFALFPGLVILDLLAR